MLLTEGGHVQGHGPEPPKDTTERAVSGILNHKVTKVHTAFFVHMDLKAKPPKMAIKKCWGMSDVQHNIIVEK